MDDIPSNLIETVINSSFSVILDIINQSLSEGIFPETLKLSHIHPTLKKTSSDQNLLADFRPIFNISYLAKTLEKCAVIKLQDHLKESKLVISKQSAYKRNHSPETALVNIFENIYNDLDQNTSILLIFLDYSSAFDTINHNILLARLENFYKINGTALKWFSSYFKDRRFHVKLENSISHGDTMGCGVPQGSILGPTIFNLYLQPIASIIESKLSYLRRRHPNLHTLLRNSISNF